MAALSLKMEKFHAWNRAAHRRTVQPLGKAERQGCEPVSAYYAVAFEPGTARFKITEALAVGARAPCRMHAFDSPILRDQFIAQAPRLRYAVDRAQLVRMRLV